MCNLPAVRIKDRGVDMMIQVETSRKPPPPGMLNCVQVGDCVCVRTCVCVCVQEWYVYG